MYRETVSNTLKGTITDERAKLREMDFTEKRQYIWEYYKLHIFVLCAVLGLIVYIIHSRLNPPMQEYLYIAWMGLPAHQEHLHEMGRSLSTIIDEHQQERYAVVIRSYTLTGDPQMDNALLSRFHALLSVGGVDALFLTETEMIDSARQGILAPVHDMMQLIENIDPQTYELISNSIQTITYEEFVLSQGQEGATITDDLAIRLDDTPLLTEMGFFTDDLYFAKVINSEKTYELAKALRMLFCEREHCEMCYIGDYDEY